MQAVLLVVVASLLVGSCLGGDATSVLLVDSRAPTYLKAGNDVPVLGLPQLSSLLAALTGLLPAHQVDQTLSQTLEGLLQPTALRKPKAHVLLHVAGLSQDEVRSVLPSERQQRQVDVAVSQGTPTVVMDAFASVAVANPDVSVLSMHEMAIEACDTDCLERSLVAAAGVVGAEYTRGIRPMEGVLTFASGAKLELATEAGRLFGVELASLHAALSRQVEVKQDVQVYEMSLLGLQGLADAFGAGAPAVAAARQALQSVLTWAVSALDAAHNGDVTFQISVLSLSPAESGVRQLHGLKEHTRRSLLSAATLSAEDELAQAQLFSTKAAGYGAFIALVYFTIAAVYCMCYMPFKKDTLLYGSSKKSD